MIQATELDLVITRTLRVPPAAIWKAWSDPAHLQHWWCPKPWTTEVLAYDLRPGGAFHTRMSGPDGEVSDNPGSFLVVEPGARLVFTSALAADWRPAVDSWMPMTACIDIAPDGASGTRYTATVLHRDLAGREQHEQMGFYDGWGVCIDQLEAYAAGLR